MSSKSKHPDIVGGGPKKVLYTLNTVRRIGLKNSAKALSSSNTCKACGLGMGGQHGGMTNELDEFPSVCNKSIQAQSTDIQQPIPTDVFNHPISEFKKLTGKEMEQLGRLNSPIFKAKGEDRYKEISWQAAFTITSEKFAAADPNRTFFYSSGRSSNEAGFVLQLLARLYGTNNVNNCSYYCHQATGIGLHNSIGSGTSTVELEDLTGCDCVFIIGANPSSNHPRLIHKLKGVRDRGGKVIIINPAKEPGLVKFAVPKSAKSMLSGGTEIASEYLQPKIGSDIAVLKAIGKYLLEANAISESFIEQHTTGFAQYQQDLLNTSWQSLEQATGIPQAELSSVAETYAQSKNAVFAWGMGITHHVHGVENVEAIANLALLRGMIGKPFAGLLPLRGHSNVQGIGTIGVKPVLAKDVLSAIEQHFSVSLPISKGLDTLACLKNAHEGDMDAALIMGGNLFEATPNTNWAEQALDKIGFKLYLTTTLNRGHVHGIDSNDSLVLPVTARDEEWQPTTQESMFNFVRLSDGGIQRLDNIRPESDILCELGKRILPNNPVDFEAFKSHNSIREAIVKVVPGMADLADIAVAKKEFHIANRLMHTPTFQTEDGRGHFIVHKHEPTAANPDFPFRLMSIRSEGQFNSIVYENNDSYRGTQERWSVLMNKTDLLELGITAGDTVDLESPYGRMAAVKTYAFDLPRGNIMAYYPEANILIGHESDPRSKTPAFKSAAVKVVSR